MLKTVKNINITILDKMQQRTMKGRRISSKLTMATPNKETSHQ